jgi:glycosyltransferase involved in cell wall biosynthesis
MQESEFISVVIPCYNDGLFLPETIEKLRKQTFTHYEIIIVNDGSNDPHTIKVLNELSKDPALTILHKENGRMSSARNYGVKHAKGEIIVALDADDYFHPSFFERALAILRSNTKVAGVTSYMKMFGEKTGIFKVRGGKKFNFLFSNQCPACAMIRKSCWDEVGGYDEEMKLGFEDWEFYLRMTAAGYLVHVIPKVLFFYRKTKKSTLKNDTFPNQDLLISYIVNKHSDVYLDALKQLISNKQILYTESRISWQNIFKMIKNRLTGKFRMIFC